MLLVYKNVTDLAEFEKLPNTITVRSLYSWDAVTGESGSVP
jgi:hypothetical protein